MTVTGATPRRIRDRFGSVGRHRFARLIAIAAALVGLTWIAAVSDPTESEPRTIEAPVSVGAVEGNQALAEETLPEDTVSSTHVLEPSPSPQPTIRPTATTAGTQTTTSQPSTTTSMTSVAEELLVLEVLATITVELETPAGYSRDLFPHWADADGDGCDTRREVLIRDAAGTAQVDAFGCEVTAGDWYSPYDGVFIVDPTLLEVDHVVPLKEAWDSGANLWSTELRKAFANDLVDARTLLAASSASNRSKGAADPSNWMPPDDGDWCRYLASWVSIKARWALSMDPSEHGRIRNLLNNECEGTMTYIGAPVPPVTLASTTTVGEPQEGAVRIGNSRYDGPDNDVVNNDSEYVQLVNTGPAPFSVAGWTLSDLANHSIIIPSGYSIKPGGELRVYTGAGDSTSSRWFLGADQAIWNNSGDTAVLRDSAGALMDQYSY